MQSQGRNVIADGRIVWTVGDLFKGRGKSDMNTKQPVIDQKTGERVVEYGFGLAIPKTALSQPSPNGGPNIWQELHAEAMTMFPGAQQIPPNFAMKFKDGDGVDDKGIPFSQREGYAGCIVVACTTRLPIKYFRWENGGNVLVNEGIKCGDFVRVSLTIKAHAATGQGKPGLYVNPSAVQFLGYGPEIINTPSGDDFFGVAAPPTMGSPTPIAPPGGMPGMMPPPAAPGQMAPPMPAAPSFQQPAPQPVTPHYGVVPPSFQPPPGGQPMAAPMQPQAPMGNGYGAPPSNAPGVNMPPTSYPAPNAGPVAQPSYPMTPGAPMQQPGYPPAQPQYPQQPGMPPQQGHFQNPSNPMPMQPGMPGQPTWPQR